MYTTNNVLITPCACAAGGRVSVSPSGLSSEGLVQDRSVRIQKILAST